MTIKDALALMGLTVESTAAEVRKKYFELSFTAHPDHNGGSSDAFHRLHQAFQVAMDYAQNAPCGHCLGKGHTYTTVKKYPAAMRMRCSMCNGTGRREGK